MTEITELLEMVRSATSPDRNIDAMLHHWALDGVGEGYRDDSPKYTASIDAALALVERVMPGWTLRMHIHPGAVYADLYRLGDLTHFPEGGIERRVTSPYYEGIRINDNLASLAVLEALLSALSSQADK